MLHRLESKTKGLVHGPSILAAEFFGNYPLIWNTRRQAIMPGDFTQIAFPHRSWKVRILSREEGEELWVRPFLDFKDAVIVYSRLAGIQLDRTFIMPGRWTDGELVYELATVETFTANGTWNVPGGVSTSDTLVVAGGGGSGDDNGGGGGAGGMKTSTGTSVSGSYAITIGPGGAGGSSPANGTGSSIGALITTTGGGAGGGQTTRNAQNGGSGGGAWRASGNTSGTGTSGEGNDGGTNSPTTQGAGGGGKGGVGGTANGNAGASQSSSITGSAVNYAGGGAGAPSGSAGAGCTAVGANGAANTGAGAGAGTAGSGFTGGSGIVVVSYTINIYPIAPGGVESRFLYKDEIVGY